MRNGIEMRRSDAGRTDMERAQLRERGALCWIAGLERSMIRGWAVSSESSGSSGAGAWFGRSPEG